MLKITVLDREKKFKNAKKTLSKSFFILLIDDKKHSKDFSTAIIWYEVANL